MTEIQNFYKDKTIFVTGATGFLGKMTVEKLLRSCDVKKLILLIRSKKGEDSLERFERFFDSPMFQKLAIQKPDFKLKIEIINGDMCLPNLGLEPDDVKKLIEEVEVIFHWAATVNFTENLKVATNINVKALRDLVNIAKNMKKLKSFLHVSTAYSHCTLKEIDENFYGVNFSADNLINLMDSINENVAVEIAPGLLGEMPNSYAFTKGIAENLIQEYGFDLPVGILRPSIISTSYKEPMNGWLDNLYGHTGLAVATYLGLIRVAYCDGNMKINIVPADYVVNCAIGAAWEISNNKQILIYNYADSPEHSLTIKEQNILCFKYADRYPTSKVVWHQFVIETKSMTSYIILDYFLHYLPARLMDFLVINKKIKFMKIYNKFNKVLSSIKYFSEREWKFKNNNVVSLWNRMSENDKELFQFDMNTLDWDEYRYNGVLGIREFFFKEPLDTIPAARRKYLKLKFLHYTIVSILLFAFGYLTYMVLRIVI